MNELLFITFIVLSGSVVTVSVVARFGFGSALGYLIAGILLSPLLHTFGLDVVSIQHFAEFGIVMLLFLIGLELSPRRLWAMRARLIGLGGLQFGLTAVVLMLAAMALGMTWTIALASGLILAQSSTSIVVQSLKEKSLLASDGGQGSFSVLVFQDIAVIPMLAIIPLLALPELMDTVAYPGSETHAVNPDTHSDGVHETDPKLLDQLSGWMRAFVTLGAIGTVLLLGTYVMHPIFRIIASARIRELYTATALTLIVGVSLLMSAAGLSPALGTFLAGVVLAESEYRHGLASDIEPFRALLVGLFLVTVGASIDFGLLVGDFSMIIGLTIGLIVLKAAVLLLLATVFKLEAGDKWLFVSGLATAGEFGFVLLSFAVSNAVIPVYLADKLLLVVALSMLITPVLIYFSQTLAGKSNPDLHQELKIFLSYARTDTQIMREMAELLEDRGFPVNYDSRDLPFGEKWQSELGYLIEQSDVVLWLVSSSSIESHWCKWELEKVVNLRKKLIPIVVGNYSLSELPEEINEIQLFPAKGKFNLRKREHVKALIDLLANDLSWVKFHTRLSDRALVWEKYIRDSDRLLTLIELEEAEEWLSKQPLVAPEPMPLVLDFIHSSRVFVTKIST